MRCEGVAPGEGAAAGDATPAKAALEPYPAVDDGFYRGRLRHGGFLDYEHSAYVLLIDRRGRQRVGFPFEQATSATLLRDIRLLQASVLTLPVTLARMRRARGSGAGAAARLRPPGRGALEGAARDVVCDEEGDGIHGPHGAPSKASIQITFLMIS